MAYLDMRPDIFYWRNNVGATETRGGGFLKFGAVGSADIIALQAPLGRFTAIEVKREVGGTVSPDQKWWGQQVEAHGGQYIVARSVDEVAIALGVPVVRVVKAPRRKRVFPK